MIEAESNPAKPKPQPEPKQLKNHHCRMVIPFAICIHASPSLCRGPRLFLSVQHSLFPSLFGLLRSQPQHAADTLADIVFQLSAPPAPGRTHSHTRTGARGSAKAPNWSTARATFDQRLLFGPPTTTPTPSSRAYAFATFAAHHTHQRRIQARARCREDGEDDGQFDEKRGGQGRDNREKSESFGPQQ